MQCYVIVTFINFCKSEKEVAGRDAGDARVETRGFIVSVDKLKLKYLICTNKIMESTRSMLDIIFVCDADV